MRSALFSKILIGAIGLSAAASAYAQINPATQIKWPSSCISGYAYSPFGNLCILPASTPTGPAGGGLTGTYPNPNVNLSALNGTASSLTAGQSNAVNTVGVTANNNFPMALLPNPLGGYLQIDYSNTANDATFNPFTGVLSAPQFNGSGSGLTGTASGLTAGSVTTTSSTSNTNLSVAFLNGTSVWFNSRFGFNPSTDTLIVNGGINNLQLQPGQSDPSDYIQKTGSTGNLYLQNNGNNAYLQADGSFTAQSGKFLANESSSGTTAGGFSFWQDGAQDTGMFSISDGDLEFYSNGTQVFYVTSAGASNLTVNGALNASSFSGSGSGLTGTAPSLNIGGNAGTATKMSTNGSGFQVWSMDSTGTNQGWQNPSGGAVVAHTQSGSVLSTAQIIPFFGTMGTGSNTVNVTLSTGTFTWAVIDACSVSAFDNNGNTLAWNVQPNSPPVLKITSSTTPLASANFWGMCLVH